ncbi:hypothetical protein Cantr_05827 [Candida viswanathii]|uniref:Uncharacterized protein n=1 Tax=Candida viswanathii TaxID=5486 RepID=A0A367XQX9_9ASCO|nr:hypothetical protein Cantr_05827 [Candida viswanathii]
MQHQVPMASLTISDGFNFFIKSAPKDIDRVEFWWRARIGNKGSEDEDDDIIVLLSSDEEEEEEQKKKIGATRQRCRNPKKHANSSQNNVQTAPRSTSQSAPQSNTANLP